MNKKLPTHSPDFTRDRSCVGLLIAALLLTGCSRPQVAQKEFAYPTPRFPRYLAHPNKDNLLKAARFAVRQPAGRCPLGKIATGESVYVFLQWGQDMDVWEAIRQAWAEKGVTAYGISFADTIGISKEEYDHISKENAAYGNDAWKEFGNFDSSYQPYFSAEILKTFGKPFTNEILREKYVPAYLDKHPEIKHIFAGTGGGNFWTDAFGPKHAPKFEGNWIYIRAFDLLTKAAEFPSDVWNLVDEKILRPVSFVSEVTFQDPEGTNLHFELTPEQSQKWNKSTGSSNHIYIYPSPLQSTLKEGAVLAAHSNHTGVYPTMKIPLTAHGGIKNIEGGGKVGELFKILVNHPDFVNARFPKSPEPGYWFFRQDGFATNPKFVRGLPDMVEGMTFMANLSERNRAGIQHLAFSYDSDEPEDLAYAKQHRLPLGAGEHTAHMHNYFPTVKWRLRDTGEWIEIANKGHVNMFDDPEVRALAARYGDPNLVFRYEWIPSLPEINMPGTYQKDFAPDPWKWIVDEWKRIQDGSYAYFIEDYTTEEKQAPQR